MMTGSHRILRSNSTGCDSSRRRGFVFLLAFMCLQLLAPIPLLFLAFSTGVLVSGRAADGGPQYGLAEICNERAQVSEASTTTGTPSTNLKLEESEEARRRTGDKFNSKSRQPTRTEWLRDASWSGTSPKNIFPDPSSLFASQAARVTRKPLVSDELGDKLLLSRECCSVLDCAFYQRSSDSDAIPIANSKGNSHEGRTVVEARVLRPAMESEPAVEPPSSTVEIETTATAAEKQPTVDGSNCAAVSTPTKNNDFTPLTLHSVSCVGGGETASYRNAQSIRTRSPQPPSRASNPAESPQQESHNESNSTAAVEPSGRSTSRSNTAKTPASRPDGEAAADEGFRVRKVEKLPIDALLEEKDLSVLGTVLTQAATGTNENMKRIAATVFAPTDAAFKALPVDINDSSEIDFPNRMEYATSIFEYHVVAPRLVPPLLIPLDSNEGLKLGTRFKKHSLTIVRTSVPSKLGNFTITVDGYASVVEIVQTKRGWIYKLDAVLSPSWNAGPSLRDYLRQHESLTKTLFLLDTAQLFTPKTEKIGPITVLALKNGAWKMNGFELPPCAFSALARPENREFLLSILKWFTIPGMWSYKDITNTTTLPNIQPSVLTVTRIFSSLGDVRNHRAAKYSRINDPQDSESQAEPNNSTRNSTQSTSSFRNQKEFPTLLIQGQEISESDIPIHNGWLHILARLPKVDGFNPAMALWDCVHEFCYECPTVAPHVLEFFDEGGLIPSQRPLEYVVPPGARPEWVCQGSSGWFPPGWKKKKWDRYIQRAKSGASSASREAKAGYSEAARRLTELRLKLQEANVKLRRIQANVDYTEQHFRPLWDPQSLISFATARRDFSGMPDCKLKDSPQQLTLHDMRYVSRWMVPDESSGALASHGHVRV